MSGAGQRSGRPPELDRAAEEALETVLDLLATDPRAPTAVRDRARARRVHVADSLAGLEVRALREAGRIADIGSGGGFPGLALAAVLRGARVDLIESVGRRCDFLRRALERSGIANARVVCKRAETWAVGEGHESYDVVTVRAVGRLATVAELASPLLSEGGALVVWKGRRDEAEEAEMERAATLLAMAPEEIVEVGPFAGSRHRHLHVLRKRGPTPRRLPRRPGMAKKRPLGS